MNEFVSSEDFITAKNTANSDENKALASSSKPGGTLKKWRYGIFFVIWLLVAWPLLTVREKNPIEHTVAIDSAHDKSMDKISNSTNASLVLIRFLIVIFQQSIYRTVILDREFR